MSSHKTLIHGWLQSFNTVMYEYYSSLSNDRHMASTWHNISTPTKINKVGCIKAHQNMTKLVASHSPVDFAFPSLMIFM